MVAHKADPSRTYTIGYNKFSDWTPEKYAAIRGLKPKPEGMSFEDNKKIIAPTPLTLLSGIGEIKVLLTPFKIKDNAGLAGLSVLLLVLRVLTKFLLEHF